MHQGLTFAAIVMVLAIGTITTQLVHAADPSQYLSSAGRHDLFQGDMPPGQIAATRQMTARGPVLPYIQPVAFSGPEGIRFSLAREGQFLDQIPNLMAGLLIGQVYRFQISNIPDAPGLELFPTVEMVDRTYPPPGLATSYPIPITLDEDDLQSAIDGQLVTRIIYLEDPQTAVPLEQPETGPVAIDVPTYDDPLAAADRLGRVVAIVRIGSLAPPREPVLANDFFFGYPTWVEIIQPETTPQP